MANSKNRCTFDLDEDLEGNDRIVCVSSDDHLMGDEDFCDECEGHGGEHEDSCIYARGYSLMQAEYELASGQGRHSRQATY